MDVADPLVFTAAATIAFSYVGVLAKAVRRTALAQVRAATWVALVAGIAATYSALRSNTMTASLLLAVSLFVGDSPGSRVDAATAVVRFCAYHSVAHMLILALAFVSPTMTLHASQFTVPGAMDGRAFFAARLRVVDDSAGLGTVALPRIRIVNDRVDFTGTGTVTGQPYALAVYGSDVAVRVPRVQGHVVVAGLRVVLDGVDLSGQRLHLQPDTRLQKAVLPNGTRVNDVSGAALCAVSDGVSCGGDYPQAWEPWWHAVERCTPGLVAAVGWAARELGAALWFVGRSTAELVGDALVIVHKLGVATWDVALVAVSDARCAVAQGRADAELLRNATHAAAVPQCAVAWPVFHGVVRQLTKVTVAFGLPVVWSSVVYFARADWNLTVAVTSWCVSTGSRVTGPAVSVATTWGAAALDVVMAALARVLPRVATLYATYTRTFIGTVFQCVVALGGVAGHLLGVAASALWACLALVFYAWGVCTTDVNFSAHVATAALQTALIGFMLLKELRARVAAEAQGAAAGGLLSRWMPGTQTMKATALLAEYAAPGLTYAVIHAVALLVVLGGSALSFLPLVRTGTLCIAFPVASTYAAFKFFGHEMRRQFAIALTVRLAAAVVFQYTIGNAVARTLADFVYLAVFGVALLCAGMYLRGRAAKPKAD